MLKIGDEIEHETGKKLLYKEAEYTATGRYATIKKDSKTMIELKAVDAHNTVWASKDEVGIIKFRELKIEAILAIEKGNGIGCNDNTIPWYIPEDLKYFKKITLGKTCVMGRNTFLNIAKHRKYPDVNKIMLPDRKINYVVSSTNLDSLDDVKVISYKQIPDDIDLIVLGGIKLIDAMWNRINVFYLTKLNLEAKCDIHFDIDKFHKDFELVGERVSDDGHHYGKYVRKING